MNYIIKNTSKRLVSIAFLIASASAVMAQTITLKGNVMDDAGEPTIGATIKVNGTNKGTVTDLDGNFQLTGVQVGQTVTISYIGYTSQNVKIANGTPLKITLKSDSKSLNEVVVVGYGTQKKTNITGAVSVVKADELPKAATASIGTMLRGRSSGMNITSNSAKPGGSMDISIRGGLSGQKPLVVIDGVPQLSTTTVSAGTSYSGGDKDNNLINLNPDDVKFTISDESALKIVKKTEKQTDETEVVKYMPIALKDSGTVKVTATFEKDQKPLLDGKSVEFEFELSKDDNIIPFTSQEMYQAFSGAEEGSLTKTDLAAKKEINLSDKNLTDTEVEYLKEAT